VAYNEYFDYNNCTTGIVYTDYTNVCNVAYSNSNNYCSTYYGNTNNYCSTSHSNSNNACSTSYSNSNNACATSHDNSWSTSHANSNNYCSTYHANTNNYCSTSHSNSNNACSTSYSNSNNACSTYYNNASDNCNTSQDYTNHVNYANQDSGNAQTLTWSEPWTENVLNTTLISDGIEAIKNIRDNINILSTIKSQQNASVDVAASSANVGDAKFNDANPATPEFVEDNQYIALRDSLYSLWAEIRGDDDSSTPALADKAPGDIITKSDWENLKIKTDELAGYVDPSYSNTISYTAAAYTNHANYANTI